MSAGTSKGGAPSRASSPDAVAPHAERLHATEPDAVAPHIAAPDTAAQHTEAPHTAAPHTAAPDNGGPNGAGPHASGADVVDLRPLHLLRTLPQPLHLFCVLARCAHYHFGHFADPGETLTAAMNRMALSCASHLPARGAVLDVGCGLGGSTRLLARDGRATLGIDPCGEAIDFARATAGAGDGVGFEQLDFTAASEAPGLRRRFDALVFLEVLQHLPDLDEVLARATALARPGGRFVFCDVFTTRRMPRDRVPYHEQDALPRVAARRGHDVLARRRLTSRVVPTLEHMRGGLARHRERLVAFFEPFRPQIATEIQELSDQCAHLGSALENGDLTYQIVTLGYPRLGPLGRS